MKTLIIGANGQIGRHLVGMLAESDHGVRAMVRDPLHAVTMESKGAEVVIADLGEFAVPSAKSARKVLADLGAPKRACVVIAERNETLWKSFRNFPLVHVRTAAELCAFDVVAGGLMIVEAGVLEKLSERVGVTNA